MENISVEKLGLSSRTKNALMRSGIFFLSDVLKMSEGELLNLNFIGEKGVQEIIDLQTLIKTSNEIIEFNEDDSCVVGIPRVIDMAFPDISGKEISNITFCNLNGIYVADADIDEFDISLRTKNGLRRRRCKTIYEVAMLKYADLTSIRNFGVKCVDEIISFFQQNSKVLVVGESISNEIADITELISNSLVLAGNNEEKDIILTALKVVLVKNEETVKKLNGAYDEEQIIYTSEFIYILKGSAQFMMSYMNYVLSIIPHMRVQVNLSSEDYFVKIGVFNAAIENLIEQEKIEICRNYYRIKFPYLNEWIELIDNSNVKQALLMRLNGNTLEECGQVLGITRERVRQIVNKAIMKKPYLREDDYKYWFEKYGLDKQAFLFIFKENSEVYEYLNMVYKHGVEQIEEMLEDENLTKELFLSINEYVNRDNVYIENEYVPCKRELLCKKLAEINCSDKEISFDEFHDLYIDFLKKNGLTDREKLLFPSDRAFAARLEDSSFVLMKYGRRFRYYPIDEVDIEELIQGLSLEQYKNVEISTLKLLNENPELMKSFDIKDEYELHNLLKKTEGKWNNNNKYSVSINRMPLLVFGQVDRGKQTEDLLFQIAPVSIDDFCQFYEEEYGVLARTVMANFTPYISKYYHNGVYSVDQPLFSEDELSFMREFLVSDFYFVEDIKRAYCAKFGEANVCRVNPRTLKELGFKIYTNYVVSAKFANAYEYFKYYLLKDDLIDFKKQDRRMTYIQIVNSTLDELRSSYELLEYGDMQFMKIGRLQSVFSDVSINMINEYVNQALIFLKDEKYFTIRKLKNVGFTHRLQDLGLDEWFNAGLIKNSRKVRFIKSGSTVIFYQGDKQITTTDFIRFVMGREKKIDIYDFLNLLKEEYGVILTKDKVTQLIKPSTLYYDAIMEKMYLSKEYYYEDI